MSTVLLGLRNDLRLHDRSALRADCAPGRAYRRPGSTA